HADCPISRASSFSPARAIPRSPPLLRQSFSHRLRKCSFRLLRVPQVYRSQTTITRRAGRGGVGFVGSEPRTTTFPSEAGVEMLEGALGMRMRGQGLCRLGT